MKPTITTPIITENDVTTVRIASDIKRTKLAIIREVKKELTKIHKYKQVSTQNWHFQAEFNVRSEAIFRRKTTLDDGTEVQKVLRATLALCVEFDSWFRGYHAEILVWFFKKEKSEGLDLSVNLWDILHKQKIEFEKGNINLNDFIRDEIVDNPDFSIIYYTVMEYAVLRWIYDEVEKLPKDYPELIDNFIGRIESIGNGDDPYRELRDLKNNFNTATLEELIVFFGDLRKVAKGQSEPILSEEEFVKLLKAVLSNKLLDEAIIPKINYAHRSVLRRLMYDFWVEFRERDIKRLTDPPLKRDYIPFACLFSFFFDKRGNKAFIDDTNESNQRRQLKTILAKPSNSPN